MTDLAAALTETFHTIFDRKDANYNDDTARMDAYHAIQALETVMRYLDIPIPERYDGQGRPAETATQADAGAGIDADLDDSGYEMYTPAGGQIVAEVVAETLAGLTDDELEFDDPYNDERIEPIMERIEARVVAVGAERGVSTGEVSDTSVREAIAYQITTELGRRHAARVS